MEERRGPRVVTQRQLEVEPTRAPSVPAPAPPPEGPPRPVPALPPADRPIPSSNQGLLDRQLRWHRERTKFESARTAGEESR